MVTASVIAIILLLILGTVAFIYWRIRRGLKRTFGQVGLSHMIKAADLNSQLTPKSVSGGDAIFLPRILKDYPQFNVNLAKNVVENNIRQLYGAGHFADVKVHRTTISNYQKHYGSSVIKFQTAFQYSSDRTVQEKAETTYTFRVKDKEGASNAALRCGYCGAPVARLGNKSCTYCGNEVILDMEQAWDITDVNIVN